jgi:hypothetical protein
VDRVLTLLLILLGNCIDGLDLHWNAATQSNLYQWLAADVTQTSLEQESRYQNSRNHYRIRHPVPSLRGGCEKRFSLAAGCPVVVMKIDTSKVQLD